MGKEEGEKAVPTSFYMGVACMQVKIKIKIHNLKGPEDCT